MTYNDFIIIQKNLQEYFYFLKQKKYKLTILFYDVSDTNVS